MADVILLINPTLHIQNSQTNLIYNTKLLCNLTVNLAFSHFEFIWPVQHMPQTYISKDYLEMDTLMSMNKWGIDLPSGVNMW